MQAARTVLVAPTEPPCRHPTYKVGLRQENFSEWSSACPLHVLAHQCAEQLACITRAKDAADALSGKCTGVKGKNVVCFIVSLKEHQAVSAAPLHMGQGSGG